MPLTQSDSPSPPNPDPETEAPRGGERHSLLDFIDDIKDSFAELIEYVSYYLAVQLNIARLTVRRMIFLAALGVMTLIASAAIVVVGAILICVGIAHALALAFQSQWIADIVTGAGVLVFVCLAAKMFVYRMTRFADEHLMAEKFEARRRRQKRRSGRDVGDWLDSEDDDE